MRWVVGSIPILPHVAADPCACIPDVMGSGEWLSGVNYIGGPASPLMTWDSGDSYYWQSDTAASFLLWPDTFAGPQSIEVVVDNFGAQAPPAGNDYIALECRRTDDAYYGGGLRFVASKYIDPTDGPLWNWNMSYVDGVGDWTYYFENPDPDFPAGTSTWTYGTGPVAFRLESDVDGAFRIYVGGTLLYSDTVPDQPIAATTVGLWCDAQQYYGTGESDSPHFSDICIKFCGDEPESFSFVDRIADAMAFDATVDGVLYGNNSAATGGAIGPLGGPLRGGFHTMWAKFVVPTTRTVTLSTVGTGFDTTLGVYTGTPEDTAGGMMTEVAWDDDSGGGGTSVVTFSAVGGVTHYVEVASYSFAFLGDFQLNVTA